MNSPQRPPTSAGATRISYELAVDAPAAVADLVSGWLFELGALGLEERENGDRTTLVVYADEPSPLETMASALEQRVKELPPDGDDPRPIEVDVRQVTGVDWETEWMRHLGPVLIGDTLVLAPASHAAALPRGRRAIVYTPRLAFGDGSHPTTVLAAESVERFCRARPEARVLDVGTGNGVLAFVALACGARAVYAIDIDDECVAAARANAALNQMTERFRADPVPLAEVRGEYDLVVANIDLATLVDLAPLLARQLAPEGQLSVTGLLAEQTPNAQSAFLRQGLLEGREETHRDWSLLEFQRVRG